MTARQYHLTPDNKKRLIEGLKAAISVPMIDSIEDFVWESIFCYMKNISLVDPFNNIRSKRLYDITDRDNQIGWSAKALQWSLKAGCEFEIVIQRADIFNKAKELGFARLDLDSDPNEIGKALLKHWHKKVNDDALAQNVIDKRICILLKNKKCDKFSFIEEEITLYDADELIWQWTDDKKIGLKGIRKSDNFCVYKWYHNQKQFFERFKFSENPWIFTINQQRFNICDFVSLINSHLDK